MWNIFKKKDNVSNKLAEEIVDKMYDKFIAYLNDNIESVNKGDQYVITFNEFMNEIKDESLKGVELHTLFLFNFYDNDILKKHNINKIIDLEHSNKEFIALTPSFKIYKSHDNIIDEYEIRFNITKNYYIKGFIFDIREAYKQKIIKM